MISIPCRKKETFPEARGGIAPGPAMTGPTPPGNLFKRAAQTISAAAKIVADIFRQSG
jgi:hypothetical protein